MSQYFEEVERGLRIAARRRAHLPWYLRLRRGHRRALIVAFAALVVAGPALAAAGLFDSGTQLTSSSCSASGGSASSASANSCLFVLSDGRRFTCPQAFALSHPSVAGIVRAKVCTPLPSSAPAVSAVPLGTTIAGARQCLTASGFPVHGGPASPAPASNANSPDGELVVGNGSTGAFVAFYTDARKAGRLEPGVMRNARHFGGQVERRGAVTIVWIRPPNADVRTTVERCVFR